MDNVNETGISLPKADWRNDLDPRMQAEIRLASEYTRNYNHGTAGHMAYNTIAKMAILLDEMERGLQRPQMHAPAPGDNREWVSAPLPTSTD